MKSIIGITLVAFALVSCGGNPSKKGLHQMNTVKTDTADMHNTANYFDYEGCYQGVFPAADCPGIEVAVALDNSGGYTMHEKYIDREAEFDSKGIYEIEENLLTMISDSNDTIYYQLEEGKLRRLDNERQPITGVLAENYVLVKEQ